MEEKVRAHVFLSGRVQGVAYRYFAEKWAHVAGISGWVRNLNDGRVEVLAEGDRTKVEEFLTHVRTGPRAAVVDEAEVRWENYTGEYSGFEITGMW
jgi:acylphosphatase